MRITLVSRATAGSVGPCGCAYLGAERLLCGCSLLCFVDCWRGAVRSACRTVTARPRRRSTDVTFASRTSVHNLNRWHHARRRIVNGCYVTVVTRIVNSSPISRTPQCGRDGATVSGMTWAVPARDLGRPPGGRRGIPAPGRGFRFAVQLSLTEARPAVSRSCARSIGMNVSWDGLGEGVLELAHPLLLRSLPADEDDTVAWPAALTQ